MPKEQDIESILTTATPAQIIAMLYERAICDLRGAVELFSLEGDPCSQAKAIHLIVHAQQIIAELNHSLNTQDGGDLSVNLARIYEYMQYRLTEAVSRYEQTPVVEVDGLLSELLDAWKSMIASGQTKKQQ